MTVIVAVCREKFESQMDQLAGKFDAVVDCTGSNFERYEKCLRPWGGSQYITFTRSGYQFYSILCWLFVIKGWFKKVSTCFTCFGCNVQDKVEGPCRAPCQLKKPSEIKINKLLGGTKGNNIVINEGS